MDNPIKLLFLLILCGGVAAGIMALVRSSSRRTESFVGVGDHRHCPNGHVVSAAAHFCSRCGADVGAHVDH